jgi:hypothetical protein
MHYAKSLRRTDDAYGDGRENNGYRVERSSARRRCQGADSLRVLTREAGSTWNISSARRPLHPPTLQAVGNPSLSRLQKSCSSFVR